MNEYKNLFLHYLESFWLRRRLVGRISAGAALVTGLLSLILLLAAPVYKATTIVSMLPSDPELRYTQGWLGRSQIDPTTIGTTTHLEYLYSRPVLETALDYILDDFQPAPATGLKAQIRVGLQGVKSAIWHAYEFLNYGRFIEISDREDQLNTLRSGLTITPMQASYILLIETELNSPELAALAANAVARAYVDFASGQSRAAMAALDGFLRQQIQDRQAEHDRLSLQSRAISAEIADAPNPVTLTRGLEAERARGEAAAQAVARADAALAALPPGSDDARRARLQADRDALAQRATDAARNVAASQERIAAFVTKRDSQSEIDLRLAALSEDLGDLRQRLLNVQLSTTEALSQVRVVEPAVPPLKPESPKVFVYTVAAGVTALFLSAMVIIVLDIFNDRVLTQAQLARLAGRESLGLLPARLVRDASAAPAPALLRLAQALRDELRRVRGAAPVLVHVVGFGAASQVDAVTGLLRIVLDPAPGEGSAPTAGSLGGGGAGRTGQPIRLVLHPCLTAAELREAGQRGEAVLAVIASGQVPEPEIVRFVREAEEGGVSPLSLAMIERGPHGG